MDKITISDGNSTITMPQTETVSVGGESVYTEATMASGRKVRDIVGFRPTVSVEWDLISAADMVSLLAMIKSGEYLFVEYPDPALGDTSGYFDIKCSPLNVFKFVNGEAVWHNVTLTMTAQGVV